MNKQNNYERQEEQGSMATVRELNALTLGAIRIIADGPDGDHQVCVQFGISKKTADAVRKLRIDEMWKIVEQIGDNFLFAARNADDTLYQLIRSGVAEPDVFMLSKLRSVIASKTAMGY